MADQSNQKSRRVELRVDGRIHFAQDCYDVALVVEDDVVKLTAALHPTLVEVTKAPPERFESRREFDTDPRDGEEVLTKVHSGSRKPKESS